MSVRVMLSEDQAMSFQNGDEKALGYFFTELHPALTHYANQWVKDLPLSEEIASDAFVKAWQYRQKLGTCAGIKVYLYTIVRRDSRKMANRLRPEVAGVQEEAEDPDTPFQYMVRTETYRQLLAAIRQLSPGNQRVIIMHLDGKNTGEIARELNLHPNTVQTQKHRAIRSLQKALKFKILLLAFLLLKIYFTGL